jgi:hypothetical protein
LVTAPVGAALIAVCGPRLLDREPNSSEDDDGESETNSGSHRDGLVTDDISLAKSESKFEAELSSTI